MVEAKLYGTKEEMNSIVKHIKSGYIILEETEPVKESKEDFLYCMFLKVAVPNAVEQQRDRIEHTEIYPDFRDELEEKLRAAGVFFEFKEIEHRMYLYTYVYDRDEILRIYEQIQTHHLHEMHIAERMLDPRCYKCMSEGLSGSMKRDLEQQLSKEGISYFFKPSGNNWDVLVPVKNEARYREILSDCMKPKIRPFMMGPLTKLNFQKEKTTKDMPERSFPEREI